MNKICINNVCFDFSIYHFIFLVVIVLIFNYLSDIFKSKDTKTKEKLYNINYNLPEHILDMSQNLTRSTLQTKTGKDYDELNRDYGLYNEFKPRLTNEPPIQDIKNYGPMRSAPQIDVAQLPNGGLADYELIRQRDLGVIANPLLPPEKRTERPTIDMTLPLLRNKYIGLPTRGSYDTYQQTGYLVDTSDSTNILKLFGRQKYPSSTLYEYYAIKSTNADQYKVPLPDIKKQIFDGDTVTLTKMFAGTYTYSEFKQEELI